jgi:hypothetical protein
VIRAVVLSVHTALLRTRLRASTIGSTSTVASHPDVSDPVLDLLFSPEIPSRSEGSLFAVSW